MVSNLFVLAFIALLTYTMQTTWPTKTAKYSKVTVTSRTTDTGICLSSSQVKSSHTKTGKVFKLLGFKTAEAETCPTSLW